MYKLIGRLFVFLAISSAMKAQTYSFQHISVDDGLSQSVVTCVVQDNEGVFWIGTMAGLTAYDGKKYLVKTKDNGLAENWITSSMKDKNGNIWFGHWGGGVSYYDAKNSTFNDMKFERFSNFKTITCIVEDKNGDIWFGTNGTGVFKYEAKANAIVSFAKEDGFTSNHISSIFLDKYNNIWFGTNRGVVVYRFSKKHEEKGAFMLFTTKDGLVSDQITSIEQAGENSIALASENNGISIVYNINKLSELKIKTLDKNNGLLSNSINCLFYSDDNTLWIGSRDEGVMRYDLNKKSFKNLSTKEGLNYFKVNTILKDREGNIWIGTDLGLNLFRGDEFQIYDESDGLVNNVVWSIAEDSQNRLWMGTNEGVSRLTFIKNPLTQEQVGLDIKNITTAQGLSHNIVLAITSTGSGEIWCGTGFGGITVLNENGVRRMIIDSSKGLASNTVYSIKQDNFNNIWAGTNLGVSKISASGKITNYTIKDGLGGDNIYQILNDSKGRLWFASIGGSLSYFENNTFKIYSPEKNEDQRFITSITEDESGNVWFGSYGKGIFKITGNEVKNYTTLNGLSSNSPYSMISDNKGDLWIATSMGIDKFNPTEITVKNYREKEGFLGVEPNPNAVCLDHKGNLWFGTIMGAVKFDLSEERINKIEPITKVEEIKVDHKPFAFPEDNSFSHDENHITFHYIGVSLSNPQHIEYKYILEGFNLEWSPVTKNQDVVYSNLPPGDYEFKVMASNNDGKWNEMPTSYAFSISPPFWRTWWFYIICIFIIFEILYEVDKIRMKNLITAKANLEKTVAIRTAELVEQKKMVEEKNNEILDSIKYAKRIQEAILPPINYVKSHLKESFILYKPKDIVAGDFYFFEIKDDDIYIAAADCTGHGVPGAMVSVVCSNALNRAVHELNITEPSKILDKVRELVVQTFQKSENEVKDGMDISFCKLNTKTRKIIFTGAHNALYRVTDEEDESCDKVLRNDSRVLCEYKGDKQPIGKYMAEKPFSQKEITLKKGDHIYLSTDGYADQFGGELGKKFLYKQYKEMLLSLYELPIEKQKEKIDNIFELWRGNQTQIDDVCVIGIKIS